MTSKVRIQIQELPLGEITDLEWAESVNRNIDLRLPSKIKANMNCFRHYKSFIRNRWFFISSKFSETIKILSQAAFLKKRDFTTGLKKMLF
jgi:hypothetical protein